MKSKIAIFGSCVTMDNFRSIHNDYKKHFDIKAVTLRLSLISIMQTPIDFSEDEIKILPETPQNRFNTNVLRNDLRKNFLEKLDDEIEYLLIDLYFDLLFGVIYTNRGIITNNTWNYIDTDFYKNLKEKKIFSFNENPYEYYVLWTKYCDKFFSYLKENFPHMKIILNKVKLVDVIKDKNGGHYIEPLFTKRVKKLNPLIDLMEEYIITNYDVIFVDMTSDVTSDENHIWGKSLVHYNIEYYKNFYKVILDITNGNDSKYYYNTNKLIHSKDKIPSKLKKSKYKLRHIRNNNQIIDKTFNLIKKIS